MFLTEVNASTAILLLPVKTVVNKNETIERANIYIVSKDKHLECNLENEIIMLGVVSDVCAAKGGRNKSMWCAQRN